MRVRDRAGRARGAPGAEELVDGIEEPTPERLRSLHEEMLRLARLAQDVETLAAAEAAQFRLERETVDLPDVARDVVASIGAQVEASGLELTTRGQSATVDADRDRLEQIARNLLANALKFTLQAGASRSRSTRKTAPPGWSSRTLDPASRTTNCRTCSNGSGAGAPRPARRARGRLRARSRPRRPSQRHPPPRR
jgi:nitrogen fixation/metabolism regulation signal transduction histidine kinase